MKRKLLFVFLPLILWITLASCSSSDSLGEESFSSTQFIGTWEDASQNNTYYVFKSNGMGMYVVTKTINSMTYVKLARLYHYTYDAAQKVIRLEYSDGKGEHTQNLSNARVEHGELSFSLNGQIASCYELDEPKWFVEIQPTGIQEVESNLGLAYSCSRFGSSFTVKLNPICVWHESLETMNLSMTKDDQLGNDFRFNMAAINESQHEYKIDIDAFRVNYVNQYRMLVKLTDTSGKSVYQSNFYISQNGADLSNPSVVGSWVRRIYDYEKEAGYYFIFKEDGSGIQVKDPDATPQESSFTYSYNPVSKSIALKYEDGNTDGIQDVTIENESNYSDKLTGVLSSTNEKLALFSSDYAFCKIECKSLDAELSHISGTTDGPLAYICYTDKDTTMRFEISPKYYFHKPIEENFDFEASRYSEAKSTYAITKGVPAMLTVTILKSDGYGGDHDVTVEKKQTQRSYGAHINIPIRQEYKYPEPSKPDHSGDTEDENNSFIIYPEIDVSDPGCSKRYVTWDGKISHYLDYENGLKVTKGAFRYTTSIEGTKYELYKGTHTIKLYDEKCKGHSEKYGTTYHNLKISMRYTINE